MAITYATLTGRITQPGTDVGIRAKVTATPLTTGNMLKFSADNRLTVGPQTAETDNGGILASLPIPLNSDTPGVLWKITAEPIDKVPGVPLRWTLGTFSITASSDLADLVEVATTLTTPAAIESVSTYAAAAQTAATDAEAAATAAQAVGTTNDTVVAGLVPATSGSATSAAIAAATDARVAAAKPAADTTSQIKAFMHKLGMGADTAVITAVGDSTGAMIGSWLNNLVAQKIAPAFPAYTFMQRSYDSTNEKYGDAATILQTGTAGLRRMVSTGASTDKFFTVADSPATSPTGELDVRMKVTFPTSAASVILAGKYDTVTNNRTWFITTDATGKVQLFFSTDGTSATQLTRSTTVALPPAAIGVPVWIRVTFDGDDGAGNNVFKAYYSTNNQSTWNLVGSTVTNVGTLAIFDGTAATQFVGRSGTGNVGGLPTEYYAFQVFTSLATGARPVIDFETGTWNGYGSLGTASSQFIDVVGNTVQPNSTGTTGSMVGAPVCLFLNGCVSGQNIAYANDATRFPKLTPKPSDLFLVNFGHNEVGTVQYRAPYKQLTDAVLAKWPDVGIIATVQNQRLSPTTNITEHAIRGGQIAALAASQRFGLVDAYKALADTGNAASYIRTDGIHPTVATDTLPTGFGPGADVIRDAAWKLFSAASV